MSDLEATERPGDMAIQKLNLLVKDIMHQGPLTIQSKASIVDAARAMEAHGHGCLLVEEKGNVVGMITERDIVRRVAATRLPIQRTTVAKIMSSPIVVIEPGATIEAALKVMAERRIRRLPVVEHSNLLGLITLTDIARGLSEKGGVANALISVILRQPDVPDGVYK